ncbi:MAG: CHASE2 domain-containing protein [Candidatus Omnitrophota bacterium]
MKKQIYIVIVSITLTLALISIARSTDITRAIRWKIYDELTKAEYRIRLKAPVTNDILLVTIGNKTLSSSDEKWPYSRLKFAEVINKLKKAGAKVIAFDFIFYGDSAPEEDAVLKKAIEDAGNVVLGAAIDEEGKAHVSTGLLGAVNSGIISKFQDYDGVVRRDLTYLVSGDDRDEGFFSWSMRILKLAEDVDLSSVSDDRSTVRFENTRGEEWEIPIEHDTNSFLIHFRAHTADFQRISFIDVLNNEYDPKRVKDKIVIVGLASAMFGDIHNTPLGWLPGITLNTNAFLALYNHDFLVKVPGTAETAVVILGVIMESLAVLSFSRPRIILFAASEIALFLALSLVLLAYGRVWDYSLFPAAVILCPALSKKILDLSSFV